MTTNGVATKFATVTLDHRTATFVKELPPPVPSPKKVDPVPVVTIVLSENTKEAAVCNLRIEANATAVVTVHRVHSKLNPELDPLNEINMPLFVITLSRKVRFTAPTEIDIAVLLTMDNCKFTAKMVKGPSQSAIVNAPTVSEVCASPIWTAADDPCVVIKSFVRPPRIELP